MGLSPEERQQVEEKIRLEAPLQPQHEPAQPKKQRRLRLVWPLLVVLGCIFVASVFDERAKPKPAPQSPEEQTADEKAAKLQLDICKGKLEKARELEVLHDLDAKGASIKVIVGPTYFTEPIDTKQDFAKTVNCFLVKGTGGGKSFDVIHWQTGKKVASWNGYWLNMD